MKPEIVEQLDANFQIQKWWRYVRHGSKGEQKFDFHPQPSTSTQLQSVAVWVLVDTRKPQHGILLVGPHTVSLEAEPD